MFVIYGVTDCPHCLRAQALCMEKDVDYAWVMMDWSKDYREWIKATYNWSTYPIIARLDFESGDEDLIGGFDELSEVLSSDE